MKIIAQFRDITLSGIDNKTTLSLNVKRQDLEELEKLKGLTLDVDLKKHSEKRSISANAYFHVLCTKIAEHDGTSLFKAKNEMIGMYGQPMYSADDIPAVIKTTITPFQASEFEAVHLKFLKYNQKDETYFYRMYRGSHTYSKDEMKKLIEGTIVIAESKNIQTMTPDELKRLVEMWNPTNEKK